MDLKSLDLRFMARFPCILPLGLKCRCVQGSSMPSRVEAPEEATDRRPTSVACVPHCPSQLDNAWAGCAAIVSRSIQAMTVAGVQPDWAALQKQLEKKATFESACAQCIAGLQAPQGPAAAGPELRALLKRASTLLRSRYNSPAFLVKGRELFRAARGAAAAAGDAGLQRELEGYIAQCSELLGDEAGPSSAEAAEQQPQQRRQQQQRQPFLFEGQLGGGGQPPAAGPGSLFGGLALAQQLLGAAAGGQEGGDGSGEEGMQQPALDPAALEEQLQQGALCFVYAPFFS